MTKEMKWTPEHFPRGTVIKTCLFKLGENGELNFYYGADQSQPVEFIIDHVKVVSTWSGRNTLVVTTTKKDKSLYDGDDVIMFNADHVTGIKSLGKQLVIKYDQCETLYSDYCKFENGKPVVSNYYLKLVLMHYVQRMNQAKEFKFSEMIDSLVQCSIFKRISSYDYTFNKKKLKRWLKQNLNRYIFTQKELDKIREKVDGEMYKDLENGFDREYDNSWVADEKPDQELKPVMDEEPRIEDYEMLSPEEKVIHDGLYGGRTEADFA